MLAVPAVLIAIVCALKIAVMTRLGGDVNVQALVTTYAGWYLLVEAVAALCYFDTSGRSLAFAVRCFQRLIRSFLRVQQGGEFLVCFVDFFLGFQLALGQRTELLLQHVDGGIAFQVSSRRFYSRLALGMEQELLNLLFLARFRLRTELEYDDREDDGFENQVQAEAFDGADDDSERGSDIKIGQEHARHADALELEGQERVDTVP